MMGRFDGLRNTVAELIGASRDEEPEPTGYAEDRRGGHTIEGGLLEHDPPKDIDDYWSMYKRIGPINSAINNFASEVIEPGWWITADDQETAEKVTEYFTNVAILNTETDVNAANLMERMVVEREVRGTVFLEKVTDSQDRHQALYPLQNNTVTIYTKPGKNMLPAPDDDEAVAFDDHTRSRGSTPTNEDGETAAYVQFDDTDPHWDANIEVGFTRDEVIKWARDADIGDARGTSRIETIADRADGLLGKLQNNDAAIESKAWPQIIFNMGTEENPWSRQEVEDFLENYDDQNLEPGTMVAVSGDVSTEEFAGETADIADDLEFDINMIMSGMPGPVYATGGFSQNVAPAVAQAQERQFRKEIKKTRRELENLFTPYLRAVAEDYGLDAAESIELHLGRPRGEVAPEDVQGNIIQYNSNANQAGEQPTIPVSSTDVVKDPPHDDEREDEDGRETGSSNETTSGGEDGDQAPQPNQANQANRAGRARPSGFAHNEVGEPDVATEAELADPRLVATAEASDEIQDIVTEVLTDARDEALRLYTTEYGDAPIAGASAFEGIAARAASDALDEADLRRALTPTMTGVVEDTLDTLGQDNHPYEFQTSLSVRHRQQASSFADSVERQVQHAVDEMLNDVSTQVNRATQNGSTAGEVAERIQTRWDDDALATRAGLIARMETKNAVNTIKLSEYDRHEEIDGVQIINPCGPNTTPLCRDLTSCGEGKPATARFDREDSIGEQLTAQTDTSKLHDGFDPLPHVPPFHFGCRSEIVPLT